MGESAADGERADLELVRVAVSPEGAWGVLLVDGVPAGLVTLERTYPLHEDAPRGAQVVKIPAGRYLCRRTRYHRGGYETYEVTGVEGHSRLLFHRGNVEEDSEGCILVGRRFGWLGIRPAVLESTSAWLDFTRLCAGRSAFALRVRCAA